MTTEATTTHQLATIRAGLLFQDEALAGTSVVVEGPGPDGTFRAWNEGQGVYTLKTTDVEEWGLTRFPAAGGIEDTMAPVVASGFGRHPALKQFALDRVASSKRKPAAIRPGLIFSNVPSNAGEALGICIALERPVNGKFRAYCTRGEGYAFEVADVQQMEGFPEQGSVEDMLAPAVMEVFAQHIDYEEATAGIPAPRHLSH